MPYIPPKDREPFTESLAGCVPYMNRKGDLTYCVYFLALEMARSRGMNYTNISTAISCLEDAAEELRRRYLNPYEDLKIQENGDI